MTSNQIAYLTLQEEKRANAAKEAETRRHNVEAERVTEYEKKEQRRHNVASENLSYLGVLETQRHQAATEEEAQRHNVASEYAQLYGAGAQYASVNLGYNQLAETVRHAQAVESETARANLASEAIKEQQNVTTQRGQTLDYGIQTQKNYLQMLYNSGYVQELSRHNRAVESETIRSNQVKEEQNKWQIILNAIHNANADRNNANRNMINVLESTVGILLH